MPDFKSLIGKLNVFKDNSALLLPVIIVAVAGLIFIPTQLLSGSLRGQIAERSVSTGARVRSEIERAVPREQWKKEAERQLLYGNDANQITLLARQSTQRELLSYKIFPEPKDLSALIFKEFGQRFRSGIEELLTRVNARECPTDAELERGLQNSLSRSSPGRGYLTGTSTPYSRTSSFGRFSTKSSEVEAAIITEICQQRAEDANVYANPADLSGYEFWGGYKYIDTGRKESIENCWYYQSAYWVIEDVVDTIGAMNSGSKSALTSPVKRLLRVSFTTSEGTYKSYRRSSAAWGPAQKTGGGDKPMYVISIGQGLTEPCTGRYCNDDIDVIHFNVVVEVGAKAVLPFMEKLCSGKQHKFKGFTGDEQERPFKHNQITILESKIRPIDREDQTHALYRYGDEPVVELDLICEYIFNKKGYDEIKPESVKTALKGGAQTTSTTGR
ncbi:MAG: hypothetical protein NTX52_07345 [Planctomycetota bacterium]|nr:hypothetical protein [Planctomycetota bacterium]